MDDAVDLPASTVVRAGDGRPMIGHVILQRGRGHDNGDALAIWHVAPDGSRTGAWIVPCDQAFNDPVTAKRMLSTCAQRTVLGWDHDAIPLFAQLEEAARARAHAWGTNAIALPEMLIEIDTIRTELAAHVDKRREANTKIVPVTWNVEVPNPAPQSPPDLLRHARLAEPACAAPVVTSALTLALLAEWAIARWLETLNLVARREYLRVAVGPPTPLPPRWERRLADTAEQHR